MGICGSSNKNQVKDNKNDGKDSSQGNQQSKPASKPVATQPNNKWSKNLQRMSGRRGNAYSDRGASPFAQKHSCRSRFLFAGEDCAEQGLELAQFDPDVPGGANVGYTVTVSDQPCSGTAGCPATAKTTVCEPTQSERYEPNYCLYPDKNQLCPIAHDCKGAKGDYIRVELRGERRVFDATVDVNRFSVEPSSTEYGDDAFVCWAVTPRTEQTLPVPQAEFQTTMDPEDPIFYSTCYVKEIEWIWEATGVSKPTPKPWKVNGECIRCDDWSKKTSSSKYEFPMFRLDPKCFDCDAGALPLSEWEKTSVVLRLGLAAPEALAGPCVVFGNDLGQVAYASRAVVMQRRAVVLVPLGT